MMSSVYVQTLELKYRVYVHTVIFSFAIEEALNKLSLHVAFDYHFVMYLFAKDPIKKYKEFPLP